MRVSSRVQHRSRFSSRVCRTHEKQNGQVFRRSLFRDPFFANSDTVTGRCANALQVSKKVAVRPHDEKKVYLCYGRGSRRSNSCTEGRDGAESLAEDYARDGEHEKGDYSISISINISMSMSMSICIGMASIVCISVKLPDMSINIHKSKHLSNVSISIIIVM